MAAARTALIVAAWLLGAPALLVAVAGSPVPSAAPSAGQVRAWLDDPLNPVYQQQTAIVLAWSVWALITLAVLAVLTAQLRWRLRTAHRPAIVSRLPAPAQSLAAALLGTAVVATAASPLLTPPAAAVAAAPHLHDPGDPSGAAPTAAGPGTDTRQQPPASVTTAAATGSNGPSGAEATGGTCVVVRGDTLWDLAAEHLGDPLRWPQIYHLNRGHVQANGHALTDPDEIDVGWILTLPAHQPTGPAPATSPPAAPAQPSLHPPGASTSPSPTTAPSHATDDGVSPPPSQPAGGTTPTPAASPDTPGPDPTHRGTPTSAPSASTTDGVDLPGGWITLGLAGGLLAAATMVWRRRRHRYRPTPLTHTVLDDADLLPPLAAMTRLRTRTRRIPPPDNAPSAAAPTVREYQAATVKPALPPPGPTGTDLAGCAALPLATGMGLAGDGALDAARGLLVATLASGSPDDPDAQGRALLPAATLATLLGASATGLGTLARLTVTTTDAEAITRLEEEIIRRSRLLAEAHAADVSALRDTDVHAEPLPQLLLIIAAPGPAWTSRLSTAIGLGRSVDIGAAVIGDWPAGTVVTVAADGTTDHPDIPRLSVLDTPAATEILAVLREAHDDTPPAAPADHRGPAQPRPAAVHQPPPAAAPDQDPAASTATPHTAAAAGRLPVALQVLGTPAVLGPDGQPSPGIRSKALELLVYLAVNRDGADLSDIMEALYPDASLRRAGERLSTAVADLRKHIRHAAGTPPAGTPRLEPVPNTGSRYHLDPGLVHVDWWTLHDHYQAAAAAPDDQQRLAHLTTALNAATGGLADGHDYDWIDTDRETVRRHRITLHTHAAALLAATDPHRCWHLLEHACQIDPLADELARTTMRAAATLGDTDAIRHRLTTLRRALADHDLDMSEETEALARQLLHHRQPPHPHEQGAPAGAPAPPHR
ncbi:BTAD domain-containing putative transcriptional regulator [Mangrovihabitans endophyticus]|uniref:LysM domain-containing protein n=1 Tax=Mangrovihabitans endophyticus TaxID=1751298 RepID=A0A8J3FS76_9ACTN|nr:BTAD domain-containing putative transcriptional regulator [Mangrovihabitans endophyticus]GGL12849.1 hypothetical protein GCM10012284_54400 [Mangrovihabitans endophyticus]